VNTRFKLDTSAKKALTALLLGLFLFILVTYWIPFRCPWLWLFHVECPGCGLTRAFQEILRLRFGAAAKYNILALPLFFGMGAVAICILVDFVTRRDWTGRFLRVLTSKPFLALMIALLILSEVYNLTHGMRFQ